MRFIPFGEHNMFTLPMDENMALRQNLASCGEMGILGPSNGPCRTLVEQVEPFPVFWNKKVDSRRKPGILSMARGSLRLALSQARFTVKRLGGGGQRGSVNVFGT